MNFVLFKSNDKKSKKKSSKNVRNKNPEIDDEDLSSVEEEEEPEKHDEKIKSLRRSKPALRNNKILSIDDEQSNSNQIEENQSSNNYWLEIYLEATSEWHPFEPVSMKFDCPLYLEKRFGKQVLYVVAFDNDNRIKDVTKRYASQWETTTRRMRISHLEEKKYWWEKILLRNQPLNATLDIEEEMKLKSE